jgi:hypothetical protein
MKPDSNAAPMGKRIAGTLHLRGDTHPPPKGEGPPKENSAEDEVAGGHTNSGQKDDKVR